MPRKPNTTEPDPKPVDAAPEAPRGSKTAAIKAALKAHPDKLPKELAELLRAGGWDVTGQRISVVKSAIKAKKKAEKKVAEKVAPPANAALEAAAPAVPGDAVSLAALQKAKKLIQELGGVKEAKTALNALAQLLD